MFIVFLLLSTVYSFLPNQPIGFANRSYTPILAFSFSQSQCLENTFIEDLMGELEFNLESLTNPCIERFGIYSTAANGIALFSTNIASSIYNYTLSPLAGLTIEMWGNISTNASIVPILQISDLSLFVFYSTIQIDFLYTSNGFVRHGVFMFQQCSSFNQSLFFSLMQTPRLVLDGTNCTFLGGTVLSSMDSMSANQFVLGSFYGQVRYLALYNTSSIYTMPPILPNSNIVMASTLLVFNQTAMASFSMNELNLFDQDGNPLSGVIVETLPSIGTLTYQSTTLLPSYSTYFDFEFQYLPVTPYDYSSSGNPECTLPYAGFQVAVTDAICASTTSLRFGPDCYVTTSNLLQFCINDLPDPPMVSNTSLSAVGNSSCVRIVATDNDDFHTPTSVYRLHNTYATFAPGARFILPKAVGKYGYLTWPVGVTDLYVEPIELCYVPFGFLYNNSQIDVFAFQVEDIASISNVTWLTVTISDPLLPCIVCTYTIDENQPLTLSFPNPTRLVSAPLYGSFTPPWTGFVTSVIYTPAFNYFSQKDGQTVNLNNVPFTNGPVTFIVQSFNGVIYSLNTTLTIKIESKKSNETLVGPSSVEIDLFPTFISIPYLLQDVDQDAYYIGVRISPSLTYPIRLNMAPCDPNLLYFGDDPSIPTTFDIQIYSSYLSSINSALANLQIMTPSKSTSKSDNMTIYTYQMDDPPFLILPDSGASATQIISIVSEYVPPEDSGSDTIAYFILFMIFGGITLVCCFHIWCGQLLCKFIFCPDL